MYSLCRRERCVLRDFSPNVIWDQARIVGSCRIHNRLPSSSTSASEVPLSQRHLGSSTKVQVLEEAQTEQNAILMGARWNKQTGNCMRQINVLRTSQERPRYTTNSWSSSLHTNGPRTGLFVGRSSEATRDERFKRDFLNVQSFGDKMQCDPDLFVYATTMAWDYTSPPLAEVVEKNIASNSVGLKTTLVASKFPPMGSKTMRVGSKTAPVGSKTAPVCSKTAPVGSKPTLVGSITTPVGSKTMTVTWKTTPVDSKQRLLGRQQRLRARKQRRWWARKQRLWARRQRLWA